MVAEFLRHRDIVQQFCEVMPDEHFGFTPWEGGFTFAGHARHIVHGGDYYLCKAEQVEFNSPTPETQPKSLYEIRTYLKQKTQEQTERILRLTDLERVVSIHGDERPVALVLGRMREHEAHHKGQMMLILRMCGVRDKLHYTIDK
jgi:uncharacterized damage-inducible protein DinB